MLESVNGAVMLLVATLVAVLVIEAIRNSKTQKELRDEELRDLLAPYTRS